MESYRNDSNCNSTDSVNFHRSQAILRKGINDSTREEIQLSPSARIAVLSRMGSLETPDPVASSESVLKTVVNKVEVPLASSSSAFPVKQDDITAIRSALDDVLKALRLKAGSGSLLGGANGSDQGQGHNDHSDVITKIESCQRLVQRLENVHAGILSRFRLDGQIALVTGGGQGIGRGMAHGLGEAGCKVAVADLNYESACSVASELRSKGIESIAIQVDVSSKAEAQAMVKQVLDTWGDLHIACNNAGVIFNSSAEETTEVEWNKTLGVNLNGVFFCCQAEAEHMLSRGHGKIINTASNAGIVCVHPQKQAAYNVSKAGVIHLTRTLAAEWASRGIRVNSISPGMIDTPLIADLHSLRQIWLGHIPMGRLGTIDELIGAIIYLASPLSDYMTGHDLVIDGGFICW